jgi:hypothetical protein
MDDRLYIPVPSIDINCHYISASLFQIGVVKPDKPALMKMTNKTIHVFTTLGSNQTKAIPGVLRIQQIIHFILIEEMRFGCDINGL